MGLFGIFNLLSTNILSLMGQSQRDDILVAQNVTPSGYKSRRDVINPMVLLVSYYLHDPRVSEFLGTGILLLVGLSIVIFMFGSGSPMAQLIPNYKLRQCMTGFLFGSVGAAIALSPIGKVSGAHINPVVTIVFWLFRKLEGRLAGSALAKKITIAKLFHFDSESEGDALLRRDRRG